MLIRVVPIIVPQTAADPRPINIYGALAAIISTSTRISGQTSWGMTSSIEAGRLPPRKRVRTPVYPWMSQLLHIHRPADFLDVYALLVSRPYDAIFDVLLALPPVPPELHALRLRLACSGRLF